ncbi:7-cyano-7-deazaguanine synthase [Micromonospora sp. LAH09]|uniref:7-cyano-7-deazaguanine synthase n=1 Tax=Micromonospora cabrerizensis TaxID=2911213 RepID=UPI001EE7E622|nr:7-cyano-7-deazaguanine synthase [Micromonospora cabrerizensis]MCG5471439.1 7-cyano-7-deazaguanine synthase [Micromonospora cabrerizensis]
MSSASFAYHYAAGARISAAPTRKTIGWPLLAHANGRLQRLAEVPEDRPDWAQDLLQIARAAYLADKLSLRESAVDGWTRTIDLSVDVISPDAWDPSTLRLLSRLLETLSADRWNISVRPGAQRWPQQGRTTYTEVEEVALFSGGLDSTAWAAERAGVARGPLLLVSYFEPQWSYQQDRALAAVRSLTRRDIAQLKASQQVRLNRRLEKSARTRGLLYLATAIYLAAAHGVSQVAVPENGQLAINPPLTPARVAACSTKSVHPGTLHLLNSLVRSLGSGVTVVNPYLGLTKGQVCQRALKAGLSATTLNHATVSCGRPPRDRPDAKHYHCGHCYPCLVRHSGLIAALGSDSTPYKTDVWLLDDQADGAVDRRALERWLGNPFSVRDLTTDTPLPYDVDPAPLADVVQSGRVEFRQMFARHGRPVTPAETPGRPWAWDRHLRV